MVDQMVGPLVEYWVDCLANMRVVRMAAVLVEMKVDWTVDLMVFSMVDK